MAYVPAPSPARRAVFTFGFNDVIVPNGFAPDGTYDIYADHRPMFHKVYPIPAPTDENGNGRGIGKRGYPMARLWWDRISDETFQWWSQWVSEGEADVPVVAITLATIERVPGGEGAPLHRVWRTGLLGRIRTLENSRPMIYDGGKMWEEGGAEVWILRLNGVIGGVPTP